MASTSSWGLRQENHSCSERPVYISVTKLMDMPRQAHDAYGHDQPANTHQYTHVPLQDPPETSQGGGVMKRLRGYVGLYGMSRGLHHAIPR